MPGKQHQGHWRAGQRGAAAHEAPSCGRSVSQCWVFSRKDATDLESPVPTDSEVPDMCVKPGRISLLSPHSGKCVCVSVIGQHPHKVTRQRGIFSLNGEGRLLGRGPGGQACLLGDTFEEGPCRVREMSERYRGSSQAAHLLPVNKGTPVGSVWHSHRTGVAPTEPSRLNVAPSSPPSEGSASFWVGLFTKACGPCRPSALTPRPRRMGDDGPAPAFRCLSAI